MTYREANELLGKRDSRKLENNTYLERRGDKKIAVRLHRTDVVIFTPTYVELHTGGWYTKTTAERIRSYAPGNLVADKRGWGVAPLAELPCYCTRPHWTGEDARPGMEYSYTGEHDADGKAVYEWRTCRTCNGSAVHVRPDWESGGHPFFEGIRVRPDGRGIMKSQPNKPKSYRPVYTESGW